MKLKETSAKEQQSELKRERESRMAVETDFMRLKVEHEAVVKDKEQLASQLKKAQFRETELSDDLTRHKNKLKSAEDNLREKEQQIMTLKQEEEKKILTLENVMNNYIKATFAELKRK